MPYQRFFSFHAVVSGHSGYFQVILFLLCRGFMISHILNSGGNNSLMKHDVVQGNNIVDLDLLRNFNGVRGLNRDNFIYISNIFQI